MTLVIHGTFAADEVWWQLSAGAETFADRLERALARRGLADTVWRPALEVGMTYRDFQWTGRNRHADRLRGAAKLARTLATLASRLGASEADPLAVNVVAHSHGGNVVLEAIRHLPRTVRAHRIVLLGTPLIAWRPGLRIVRLLLGVGLLGLVSALLIGAVFAVLGFEPSGGLSAPALLGLTVLGVVSYGWLFLLGGTVVDVLWWPLGRVWLTLVGRGAGQAYGPLPNRLAARLHGGPIVLLSSHQDEADLALQLGAAPRRLYAEWIKGKGWPTRGLELVLARPFVAGAVLPLLGVLLERYVLGFSWLDVLLADAEMADLTKGRQYPSLVLRREDVTACLLPLLTARARPEALPPIPARAEEAALGGTARRIASLKETLVTVGEGVVHQIKLRHSMYYESEPVLERIADVLADRA